MDANEAVLGSTKPVRQLCSRQHVETALQQPAYTMQAPAAMNKWVYRGKIRQTNWELFLFCLYSLWYFRGFIVYYWISSGHHISLIQTI